MNAIEIQNELAQCDCSDQYWKTAFSNIFVYTDGIKKMWELCEAYWLLTDIILFQKLIPKDEMLRYMQFWKLTVKDKVGILTCSRDKGDVVFTHKYEFTDFPLDEIKINIEGDTHYQMVIMLPSER